MNSKQKLQKVFYLPLEYQIFLPSPSNLSTAIFPYSFHCCKRLRKTNFVGSNFISQPKELPSRNNFKLLCKDLNQNSVLSNHYFIPSRCKRSSKMSNNDIIFIESINQTGSGAPGFSNINNSEVTITKFVTTNANKATLGDVIVLHSTFDSNPKAVKTFVNNQDVVFVESIEGNSNGRKRKSNPVVDHFSNVSKNLSSGSTQDENEIIKCAESTRSPSVIEKNKDEMVVNKPSSAQKTSIIETRDHEEPRTSLSIDIPFNIAHNLQFDNNVSNSSIDDTPSPDNSSDCIVNPHDPMLTLESGPSEVKIMSYNILAQTLLVRHIDLYRHCKGNMQVLKQEHRFRNIINEITHYNCDIVCLQEVEEDDLDYFVNILGQYKYKYVYKKRTGDTVDGCCIFYKYKKYAVAKCKFVEYFKSNNHSLMNKHNVGVIVNLKSENQNIIVANTHFLYNPQRSDIRYAQCKHLLSQIKHMYETSANENTSIVITGDFNSSPNSKLINFILNNKDFKFKSAYGFNRHFASTFHDSWSLVDYIFYTSDILKLSAVKALPQSNRMAIDRIPNEDEGSDHFSLVAIFRTD